MHAPDSRVRVVDAAKSLNSEGRYVVYWMNAQRRTRWNFGLQHALARAIELEVPLVVVEALSCSYRWASDRMHTFAVEGMRDVRDALASTAVTYHPYVEPEENAGRGLHEALAADACLYVTDEWPCFHLPQWVAKVAKKIDVRCEAVDSCGIIPLSWAEKAYSRAVDFRRHMQKRVHEALQEVPLSDPLDVLKPERLDGLPAKVTSGWPATNLDRFDAGDYPIDHSVPAVESKPGGEEAGRARIQSWVFEGDHLRRYKETRNGLIGASYSSKFSPWLALGCLSPRRVAEQTLAYEGQRVSNDSTYWLRFELSGGSTSASTCSST
ncbi:MAG: hypothetical protein AAGA20_18225, partial [Planctomycetota bacterium]